MEFLEIFLIFIALLLMIFKPEKEKLAFGILVGSWIVMAVIYFGMRTGNILPIINL
ncbi:hypothetical protein [Helicobacter pametensis]|uniref:disulfide bond formation protein Dba n=1 Tax=Helicobacter pametensis TaxID=95149 RepID=UPI000487D474|nr:hypothetical protein [Helicobacter pametensis]